ncbi:hypothetical protein BpHYR1_030860 [Brachionus plicatilis]|uniref:Uncharacterized protein n=1 Tax=Brachionus plicatilis TaxID=10195 RepID=A0A3M7Q272_BRAPC|nr:hypothetical protein BpHYR1_030860 [Brachionus plicatilis]
MRWIISSWKKSIWIMKLSRFKTKLDNLNQFLFKKYLPIKNRLINLENFLRTPTYKILFTKINIQFQDHVFIFFTEDFFKS